MNRFKDVASSWYPAPGIPVHSFETVDPAVQLAVAALLDAPYGEEWKTVFQGLDIVSLFQLSLQDLKLFDLILTYVRSCTEEALSLRRALIAADDGRIENTGVLAPGGMHSPVFPMEIFLLVMPLLRLAELVQISQVSFAFRSLYPSYVEKLVDSLLLEFRLDRVEVRFMQTATLTILSGACIAHLLHGPDDLSFDSLEIFCPPNALPWVSRFLDLTTSYTFAGRCRSVGRQGVVQGFSFTTLDGIKSIRLFSSTTPSALHCLAHSLFSHQFGAVTHRGLVHFYPLTTFAGLTIPNRPLVRFSTAAVRDRLLTYISKCKNRGVELVLQLPGLHTCGAAPGCPSTPRVTLDRGCFVAMFETVPFGADTSSGIYPGDYATAWSLEAVPCTTGHQMQLSGACVVHRDDPVYASWKQCVDNLVAYGAALRRLRV